LRGCQQERPDAAAATTASTTAARATRQVQADTSLESKGSVVLTVSKVCCLQQAAERSPQKQQIDVTTLMLL
jgi:hypothetical protein